MWKIQNQVMLSQKILRYEWIRGSAVMGPTGMSMSVLSGKRMGRGPIQKQDIKVRPVSGPI